MCGQRVNKIFSLPLLKFDIQFSFYFCSLGNLIKEVILTNLLGSITDINITSAGLIASRVGKTINEQ